MSDKNIKIAILTAISGNRDKLNSPIIVHKNVDYFAFVDEIKNEVSPWKQIKMFNFTNDDKFLHRRNAKIYKIMPEFFIPGYDYYFWVDATHDVFVEPEKIIKDWLKDSDIAVFKHKDRKCSYEEASEIIKLGYDHTNNIINQTKEYKKQGFPQDFGLFELPVIVRRNSFEISNLNLMWWEQICRFSSRDQISFPFCLWKTKNKISIMPGFANGINPATNKVGYNDLIPQTRTHL